MDVDGSCTSMEVDGSRSTSMETNGRLNGSSWKFPRK